MAATKTHPNRVYPFKKGVSGNPKGRPVGAVCKYSMAQAKRVARDGMTPLQFLLIVMRAEKDSLKAAGISRTPSTKDRLEAAKTAAPYCHRKLPIGIDNGHGGPIGVYTAQQLEQLSDEELDKLSTIMGKLVSISTLDSQVPDPIATELSLGAIIEHSEIEDSTK